LYLRCVDRIEILASIRGGSIDGIVTVGLPSGLDAESLEEARAAAIGVVGLARDPLDAEAFRCLGIAALPVGSTVPQMLEAMSEKDEGTPRPPVPPPGGLGRLIAVWGPKGAPGRTRIAAEMAFMSARREPRTLLADADPYGGDLLQLLGVVDELPSVVWAARAAAKKELNASALYGALRRTGRDGPVLLPGILRPQSGADISEVGWRAALEQFKSSFAVAFVDVGFCLEDDPSGSDRRGGRNRVARHTITYADRLVAVCRADPIGIKNFVWAFQEASDLVDADRILVVANRVLPGQEREVRDILRARIGKAPVAFVPDRHEEMTRAVLRARSLTEMKPGSDVPSAVGEILLALGADPPRKGLLTRLGGRA
ncbi:MAG: AAA family ATPase, partial [Actinomycetota bacterium]